MIVNSIIRDLDAEVATMPQNVWLLTQDRPGELDGFPSRRVVIGQLCALFIALA